MNASLINQFDMPGVSIFPESGAGLETRIVTGVPEIVKLQPLLLQLSLRYGQQGTMDHLEYFLSFEESAKKTPHLVLIGTDLQASGVTAGTLVGALLMYEYRVLGWGTRVFATDDTSGRRTMVSPPGRRMIVARLACQALLQAGARLAVQSFIEIDPESGNWPPGPATLRSSKWLVTTRRRLIRSHLPLETTMDATLAKIGQRTRSNLRYYRRRAEAQLGCTFVKDAQIGREEFKTFNRECTYAVTDERAGWRFDSVAKTPGMFLCGIRDGKGRWLSVIGARRYYGVVEIDWQMNRDDLPAYSLSTVMRAYFMEEEIARGARKMFIEGGTPHAIRHSFAMHMVRDVAVANNRWFVPLVQRSAPVLRRFLNRYLPKSNFVLQMLTGEKLQWHPWS